MMPHIKDTYYFPHDSNARRDPKILALRSIYGMEGYGRYWSIVEMLREQPEYKLNLNSKYACKVIAMELECDEEVVAQFIHDCINEFKLFESDGEYFWSNSLMRRMEIKNEKSEKARQAARARWGKGDKSSGNADALQPHSESNASKVKESKEKVKESRRTPPTVPPMVQYKRIMTGGDNNGDSGFKNIVSAFSNNIHPITPMEAEGLSKWIDDGLEPELIIWAIRQAVLHGKRTTRYIDAILCNLHSEGVTTLAAAEARERDREQRKRDQPAGSGRLRDPTPPAPKLSSEEKERINELNRLLAERKALPP